MYAAIFRLAAYKYAWTLPREGQNPRVETRAFIFDTDAENNHAAPSLPHSVRAVIIVITGWRKHRTLKTLFVPTNARRSNDEHFHFPVSHYSHSPPCRPLLVSSNSLDVVFSESFGGGLLCVNRRKRERESVCMRECERGSTRFECQCDSDFR